MVGTKNILIKIFLIISIIFFLTTIYLYVGSSNNENFYLFGYKPFLLISSSMEPKYKINSLAVIKKGGYNEVEIGDVIVFRAETISNKLVFHRVIEKKEEGFLTKGDNNIHGDEEYITEDNYIGREVFHTNNLSGYFTKLTEKNGILIYFLLPVFSIILVTIMFSYIRKLEMSTKKKLLIAFCIVYSLIVIIFLFTHKPRRRSTLETNEYLNRIVEDFLSEPHMGRSSIRIDNEEIYGVIEIDKIDIKYPIIKYVDEKSLNYSITYLNSDILNQNGNAILIGDGTTKGLFFHEINKLFVGDIVKITDCNLSTIEYIVSKSFITNDDESVYEQNPNKKELTLIADIYNNKRLVVLLEAK